MKKPTISSISLDLQNLIEGRAKEMLNRNNQDKQTLEDITLTLRNWIIAAKDLKQEFDENNLKISSIEAEGYLRFALQVEALLKDYDLL